MKSKENRSKGMTTNSKQKQNKERNARILDFIKNEWSKSLELLMTMV